MSSSSGITLSTRYRRFSESINDDSLHDLAFYHSRNRTGTKDPNTCYTTDKQAVEIWERFSAPEPLSMKRISTNVDFNVMLFCRRGRSPEIRG